MMARQMTASKNRSALRENKRSSWQQTASSSENNVLQLNKFKLR
jgi:hypothetical protein